MLRRRNNATTHQIYRLQSASPPRFSTPCPICPYLPNFDGQFKKGHKQAGVVLLPHTPPLHLFTPLTPPPDWSTFDGCQILRTQEIPRRRIKFSGRRKFHGGASHSPDATNSTAAHQILRRRNNATTHQIYRLHTQYARIQLSVMAHCLAELILRRISKHWTNMPYLFG